tara:strand:+ start:201 stop:464 length:264 start_codon:yes stop_codon:yes gene_type:complete
MTNSKTKILNEFLINQSVIDLLIDKGVFTEEELKDSLEKNITLFKKLAQEYSKLLIEKQKIDIKFELNEELDEDVLEGLYYGPIGQA